MDNGDQIQQTNLVSDDTVAAMNDTGFPAPQPVVNPVTPLSQTDPLPTGSAADPGTPPPSFYANTAPAQPSTTPPPPAPVPMSEPTVTEPSTTSMPPFGTSPHAVSDTNLDNLDDIKRNALEELRPLIEHIEQSPEERFETVMMMIRSNDDPKLIAAAYEAAKGIEDEKIRASAFLNIVSEIEYLKSKT